LQAVLLQLLHSVGLAVVGVINVLQARQAGFDECVFMEQRSVLNS
jgi:hypothetical protein